MMNVVHYNTEHGTVGEGYVADVQDSPLSGRTMIRVVDFVSEANDPDAGKWVPASDCWEPDANGPQTLGCFI